MNPLLGLALLGGAAYLWSRDAAPAAPSATTYGKIKPQTPANPQPVTPVQLGNFTRDPVVSGWDEDEELWEEDDDLDDDPEVGVIRGARLRAISFSDDFDAWLDSQIRNGVQTPAVGASNAEWGRWTKHMMIAYKRFLQAQHGNREGRRQFRDDVRAGRREMRQERRERRGAP